MTGWSSATGQAGGVRRPRTTWVAVVATVVSALAPALPFARSGSRVRSGYELVRTAGSIGVLEGAIGRMAVVALALLPLLAAGAFAAASLRRHRVVATLAVMAGIVTTGAGVAVHLAPISVEAGATVAVAVGLVAVAAGIVTATTR